MNISEIVLTDSSLNQNATKPSTTRFPQTPSYYSIQVHWHPKESAEPSQKPLLDRSPRSSVVYCGGTGPLKTRKIHLGI